MPQARVARGNGALGSPAMLEVITEEQHGVAIDIVYATDRNFTGAPVYRHPGCFLHPDAARLFERAVRLARAIGLKFLVYDAFRPSEAQWLLWRHTPDPEFLADPRRGSPHSMGAAIDLTLIDATTGQCLDMGTGFDDMRSSSHHGDQTVSAEAQRNRALLLGLMTAADFDFYRNEWWHYQLFRPRGRYPVLTDAAAGTGMM